MAPRNFQEIENRWRSVWESERPYLAVRRAGRPKRYILDYFPYPSGSGLSVGHARNYVPSCISARFHRMRGFDVLHPMGWDAFGLPAENYAVLHGIHPKNTIRACKNEYRRQLQLLECSYDWSREIDSSDPEYYRFTQRIFLLLFERDLAYRAPGEQWWCPTCKTILANEQVEHGRCWRCSAAVETKTLHQWYFRITRYADRLLDDLGRLDWPEPVKTMQRNWIGRTRADGDAPASYRLRDWLISRQRYWGAPIPIVHCSRCGPVPLPETELPLRLPDLDDYTPNDDGRSPLSRVDSWVNVPCPACGASARRETDTMDGFACSSWYFLRFASPHCASQAFEAGDIADWLPVDIYVGGAEHAVMHLLYARFWTKVLFDAGWIPFDEPFQALRTQGAVRSAVDGKRMAKSRPATLVTPDEVVARHGTDALRAYLAFLGPFDNDVVWSESGIVGITRFLDRYWTLATAVDQTPADQTPSVRREVERRTAVLVERITRDLERFRFNTAVARLMEFLNWLSGIERPALTAADWRRALETFTLLLAPICPFVTEEVWRTAFAHSASVHASAWPTSVPRAENDGNDGDDVIAVQVNGRVRSRIEAARDATDAAVRSQALDDPRVRECMGDSEVVRVVIVPGRLVNIVTRGSEAAV